MLCFVHLLLHVLGITAVKFSNIHARLLIANCRQTKRHANYNGGEIELQQLKNFRLKTKKRMIKYQLKGKAKEAPKCQIFDAFCWSKN